MAIKNRYLGIVLVLLAVLLAVLITFLKVENDQRDAYLCAVYHSTPGLDPTKCPVHTENTSWYFTLAYAGLLVMAVMGVYMTAGLWWKKEGWKREEVKIDPGKLDSEEKKICELLQQGEGSRYQSDLIQETGFSKVHMTRILDRLEGKRILERKRRGMTNIVILK